MQYWNYNWRLFLAETCRTDSLFVSSKTLPLLDLIDPVSGSKSMLCTAFKPINICYLNVNSELIF